MQFAMDFSCDSPLQVCCPTLVQPKVFPGCIADEVATPTVRQFVGNDIDVLPIFANDRGSGKSIDGILHATIREGCGKNEDVVRSPCVRVHYFLANLKKVLHICFELPLAFSKFIW